MKTTIILTQLIFFFFHFTLNSQTQIDIYLDGIEECLDDKEFLLVQSIFSEIDNKLNEKYGYSPKRYLVFSRDFCDELIEDSFFKIDRNEKLDSLIREGHKFNFWIREEIDTSTSFEIGDYIVTPPNPDEIQPTPPEDIERIHFDTNSSFIRCSKVFTLHKVLLAYYFRYDHLGIGGSTVKLCGLQELFSYEDYDLKSMQYFIAMDVILQRILHVNQYSNLFEEK